MANIDFQPLAPAASPQAIDFQPLAPAASPQASQGASPASPGEFQTREQAPQQAPAAPAEGALDKFNSYVSDPISAVGQGVAHGLTDTAGDIGGFVTQLLGHLSPSLEKHLDSLGNSAKSLIQNSEQKDVNENYPVLTSVGRGTGATLGTLLGGSAVSAGKVAEGASTLTKALSVAGDVGGNAALGSALAGKDNRIAGALLGGAVPLATKALGVAGSYLSSNARQAGEVSDLVKKVNSTENGANIHDATNAAFKEFTSTPGTVDTSTAKAAISDYLSANSERLSGAQKKAINGTLKDMDNVTNLEDLHQIRKDLSSDISNKFLKGDSAVSGSLYRKTMDLQKSVEGNLKDNASNLGVLDKYNSANNLYKQSRDAEVVNNAYNSTETPLGGVGGDTGNKLENMNRSIMKLKQKSTTSSNTLSAFDKLQPDTQRMLTGVQRTINEANSLAGIPLSGHNINLGWVNTLPLILKASAHIPVLKQILQVVGSPKGRALVKPLTKAMLQLIQARGLAPSFQDTQQDNQ
jgi:hypothetical protein